MILLIYYYYYFVYFALLINFILITAQRMLRNARICFTCCLTHRAHQNRQYGTPHSQCPGKSWHGCYDACYSSKKYCIICVRWINIISTAMQHVYNRKAYKNVNNNVCVCVYV